MSTRKYDSGDPREGLAMLSSYMPHCVRIVSSTLNWWYAASSVAKRLAGGQICYQMQCKLP